MASSLTKFKVGGEDLSDIYVDTETVEDLLGGQISFDFLSDEGKSSIANRSMWSWGSGLLGYLGSDSLASRSSPVQVGSLSNWYDINAMVVSHAIKSDGTLWTWGGSTPVQGLNTAIVRSSPTQVGTLTGWKELARSSSRVMFAIRTDGSLWGWGIQDALAQAIPTLGLNDTIARSSPTQIGTLTNWKQVTSSSYLIQQPLNPPNFVRRAAGATLATKTDGTLWAWGSNNRSIFSSSDAITQVFPYGHLGLNSGTVFLSSPVQVGTLTDWSSVRLSGFVATALKKNGTLWSWGSNGSGSLGLNDVTSRSSPVQIGTGADWKYVDSGSAIKTDGTLWTWGSNINGDLGVGDTINRSSPVQVGTLTNWKSVVQDNSTVMAIKTDGTLWGWSNNVQGRLGLGDTINRSSPVQVGTDTNWRKVDTQAHTIALKA